MQESAWFQLSSVRHMTSTKYRELISISRKDKLLNSLLNQILNKKMGKELKKLKIKNKV